MSQPTDIDNAAPIDLSRWRNLPNILMGAGGVLAVIGLLVSREQFAFSWLLAFMFYTSLMLGGLGLVMLHHLFDANWSVGTRRICEHLANLAPTIAILWIPIGLMAPWIYQWMNLDPHLDHALHAKLPLFTMPMFYLVSIVCLGVWILLANRLRYWSLRQDETGAAECTHKMRFYAAWGIFAFAFTLTFAAIMWMKALQHQWFSTMYGVYYFAGSMWVTIATVYVLAMILKRNGPLKEVVGYNQFYYIGSLLFAFTVFYAYIAFSQYFIIWNANIPEETFWYVLREKGSWWDIGLLIIFGHFFVPFLLLLRIDWKLKLMVMIPLAVWAWFMHFIDMSFNIIPVLHPDGFVLHWVDIGAMLFMGGLLAMVFIKQFNSHSPYPQKDPRFAEMMHIYVEPRSHSLAGREGQARSHGDAV